MPTRDSPIDKAALGRARALLKPPVVRDSGLAAVGAAAFFAVSALSLAMVTIMVPPVITPSPTHAAAPR